MSVVVAKKTKDGFIIGCDSIVTKGQVKDETTKIFRSKNNNDIVCGVVGSLRDLNILSTMPDLLDAMALRRGILDTDSIINYTIKNIKERLKDEGRLIAGKEGECMNSSCIIAYKDKCWSISQDFAVIEIDNFEVIGAPEEFALGAYEILVSTQKSLSDKEIVIKVIDVCIKRTIYVDYPILIADTTKNDIEKVAN